MAGAAVSRAISMRAKRFGVGVDAAPDSMCPFDAMKISLSRNLKVPLHQGTQDAINSG